MKALRVVLFGPESTGKSSLTERLAASFAAPWSAEFVREFWDTNHGVITANDLDAIGQGQMKLEDVAAARAELLGSKVVFHDTDLLTCTIWDDLLFPRMCPDWIRVEARRRAKATDLFLFCDTDLAWSPDPQRCFPDEADRIECRKIFLDAIEGTGARWTRVWGASAEREARATRAIDHILNRCSIK